MKKVSGQVKTFGGVIQKNSAQIKRMGRQMTVAGAAIIGVVGLMVKAYGSFDEAMVRSLAIMGDVSPAMRKEMAKTAKELSTKSTFAAKELAEAYYFLASAGMSAEASISALPPVSRFAQAGAFDLALATDLLTDAQTALGLSSKDVIENEKNLIRVSDVLVGANTLANASVLQFAESLTNKAAAAIVNLNKEVEEGVAVLAAYADKGVKGRLAGQRLTMMLNGLFDATRNNKKAWDEAGISLFNADESMRSIADIIQDLEGRLGSMTVKQREAELATLGFNIKTKDSILTLMGSSEKIRGWTEDLKKMGGITKEVADKQMEAFNAKMTVLGNIVKNTAITIGQLFVPMVEKAAKKIGKAAEKTSEWAEAHEDLAGVLATSVAALGGTLLTLGGIGMILPKVATGFNILATAAKTALGTFGVGAILAMGLYKVFEKLKIGPLFNPEILDEQTEAYNRQRTAIGLWSDFADKAVRAGIADREELIAIWDKYEQNTLEAYAAIAEGTEGKALQRFFKELVTGQKEVISWATSVMMIFEAVAKRMEKLAKKTKETGEAVKETGPVFTSWATMVGKIFHDTSVRAAKMRAKMKDVKLALPPVAINMPKMSLEDFAEWYKNWLADLMKDWPKTWKESFQLVISDAALFTSSLGGLFNQMTENQIANIEKEYEARKKAIENSLMTEKSKTDAMEKLDKEFEKKRKKAMRAQAIRTKAVGILEAIIHTASAVVEALPNIPLAIAVGIMGAIQTALIAAAPLPTFAEGGEIGKGELGIVGDEGPELFMPRTAGTIVPLREGAGMGALRPIYVTIAPSFHISTMDEIGVREWVRGSGLPAIVEAIKVGIQKPELQDALRIK